MTQNSEEIIQALVNEIYDHAKENGSTICTAESCSAGRLAAAFAKGEKASECFDGGIVAYTKEAKIRLLDVPVEALRAGTAVCGTVAEAMALGAVRKAQASLGVSITGVAGPSPDEDGNPVGLVYCGVARSDGSVRHQRLMFAPQEPGGLIDEACVAALRLLRDFAFSDECRLAERATAEAIR